jgi:uncharacterized protein
MTLKRIFLIGLTAIALLIMGTDLIESFSKPQFNSRLALYESDLRLHLAEYKEPPGSSPNLKQLVEDTGAPIVSASKAYEEARQQVQSSLKTNASKLDALKATPTTTEIAQAKTDDAIATTQTEQAKQQTNLEDLTLRLGILQTRQNKVESAQQLWTELLTDAKTSSKTQQLAASLSGLWSEPTQVSARAATDIQSLEGWYRFAALDRLYAVTKKTDDRTLLQAKEAATAQNVLVKLGITGVTTTASIVTGVLLFLFVGIQRLVKGKESWIAGLDENTWTVPWDWEDTWLVMVAGFFLVGQLLVGFIIAPVIRSLLLTLKDQTGLTAEIAQGLGVLGTYSALAIGALTVLYFTIKSYLPLEKNWFSFKLTGNGFSWGFGGYLVAFPLVLGISILNSQIWQGQGGSNPLLPILLEGKDPIALALFFVTTAIAAPIFEELLFRGFLLPSLTRYVSTSNAVLLSGFIFALVHLSLSEVLPLTVLGILLGFVYARTQNLLASMLLHSLWNSGTLISLFVLGSAGK